MGFYIETNDVVNKAMFLVDHDGGEVIPEPQSFAEIPPGKALIVVVHNPRFEAAGFAFNEREFLAFTFPGDFRPKDFVLLDRSVAEKLTGYK